MAKYILALDQGDHQFTGHCFDHEGNNLAMVNKEFPPIYPQPGWVEHNPMDIWNSQLEVAKAAMEKAGGLDRRILLPLESRISVKPPLSGTRKPANQCTMLSSGNADAPLRSATILRPKAGSIRCATRPA